MDRIKGGICLNELLQTPVSHLNMNSSGAYRETVAERQAYNSRNANVCLKLYSKLMTEEEFSTVCTTSPKTLEYFVPHRVRIRNL